MPEIKITYFDLGLLGRAEMCRLALEYGGIPFTDNRLTKKEWSNNKSIAPYAQLPLITIDGDTYAESASILRYCGKLAGLYPEDQKEALFVDEILDALNAGLFQCFSRYQGDDKDALRADREKMVREDYRRYLGGIESQIEKYGGTEYVLKSGISIADLQITTGIFFLKNIGFEFVPDNALDPYKKLNSIAERVTKDPKFVNWFQKHPVGS